MCEVVINVPNEICEKSRTLLYIRLLFHLLCEIVFIFVSLYGVYMVFCFTEEMLKDPFLRDVRNLAPLFLTNWNFCFHTVFLTLSLTYDVLEWLDRNGTEFARKLKYYRDVLFCGLVVPMTLFISSMFWIVFLIDRELVFPKVYDEIVPWWFNHCVHTNITIVILLETLIQARRHPTDLKVEVIMNGTVGVLYAVVYYSIYFFAHRWLYGVFGVMTWWQVCLYQILIWGSCFVFYFIQFPINRIFHKEDESSSQEQKNCVPELKTVIPEMKFNGEEKPPNPEVKEPSLSNKPWSLKYRSTKNQFENSSL